MRGHDLRTWIILETETGVRVMRWCLRGGSKGELREANSGKDVGVEEDRLGRMRGWANMCLGGATWRLCLWSEIGKRWKIGLMVEMCWVLCPFFFFKVCALCVYEYMCLPSWVCAYFPVVAFAFCPLAHMDLSRLPRCLWRITLYVDSMHISTSVCRCVWGSSRGVWRGAVQ